jgi:UDPglucose 6-dehydrogenase
MKKKITVIGCGYVGLVTGIGLSELGYEVICTDKNRDKIDKLQSGTIPFYEPGLNHLRSRNVLENRLRFSKDVKDSLGTPPLINGETDLSQINEVVDLIIESIPHYQLIIMKSTVPPGTNRYLASYVRTYTDCEFDWVSNPEFLREGRAVNDFFSPDRIIVGCDSEKGKEAIVTLYKTYNWLNTPFLSTDFESAEIIKYASNAFLGMKISFINQIAQLSEKIGSNMEMVTTGVGLDPRIAPHFLKPGPGFGGSCLPKDISSLIKVGEKNNVDMSLLKETMKVNDNQKLYIIGLIENLIGDVDGKNIGILGLTFKANTDDIRESPSIRIIQELINKQVKIKAYDPQGMRNFFLKNPQWNIEYCQKAEEVFCETDLILILTEWEEFINLDFHNLKQSMRGKWILDTRNILSQETLSDAGYLFHILGAKNNFNYQLA